MGFKQWWELQRINRGINNLAIRVRELEKINAELIKFKLLFWKYLVKGKGSVEEIAAMKDVTERQKNEFTELAEFSYLIETGFKLAPLSETSAPLRDKFIEARGIIDSLVSVFTDELQVLRSITSLEQKVAPLRDLIRQELAIYKRYEQLRKRVPLEVLVHVEEEWKARRKEMFSSTPEKIARKLAPLFAAAITIGIIYLFVDDEEYRKRFIRPEYFTYLLATTFAIHKIEIELKKIIRVSRLEKSVRKL